MNRHVCPNCSKPYRPGVAFCSKCGLSFTMRQMAIGQHLQPEQVLNDRYTIVRLLGQGGMGAVYLAMQSIANQQRQVVIKEMLDYLGMREPPGQGKERARQLFEAEAATLTSLNIVGVPLIFDYFSENNRHYIVMQYIEGKTLQTGLSLRNGHGHASVGQAYSVENVRRWGVQICKVLEKLAARNIVHLDIKPANLISDTSGQVWLVDFGAARTRWMSLPRGKLGLHNSGIAGTTGYAPPEQYKNKIEPRSDVYALAATLYHLLTDDDPRQHPFHFPGLGTVGMSDKLPTLEETVKAALKYALQEDVTQRPTARELRELLEIRPENGPIFIWQDGSISKSPKTLGRIAMSKNGQLNKWQRSKWKEASGYFANGLWLRWFKTIDDRQTSELMQQSKTHYTDPDLALDHFLRALDPSLPSPSLMLKLDWIDFGIVPWQEQHTQTLELHNSGGGALFGQVMNVPAWMDVTPLEFTAVDKQALTIKVDTHNLTPRAQPYTTMITIDGGLGGKKEVKVTMLMPEPRLDLKSSHLRLHMNDKQDALTGTLTVRNLGSSPFDGHIEWNKEKGTLIVEPTTFRCAPNDSQEITIKAATNGIGVKEYISKLTVTAQAGEWSHSEQAQVYVSSPLFRFHGGIAGMLQGVLIGIPLSMLAHWVVSQMILPELNGFTSTITLLGEESFMRLQEQQQVLLVWAAFLGALGGGWGTQRFTDANWWSRYLQIGAYGGALSLLILFLSLLLNIKDSTILMINDLSQFIWSAVMIASSLMVIGAVFGMIWGGVVAAIRRMLARIFRAIVS